MGSIAKVCLLPDAWECHVLKVPPADPFPEQSVETWTSSTFRSSIYPVFYDLKVYTGRVITTTGDMVHLNLLQEYSTGLQANKTKIC